jgi:hypothetical protein
MYDFCTKWMRAPARKSHNIGITADSYAVMPTCVGQGCQSEMARSRSTWMWAALPSQAERTAAQALALLECSFFECSFF